MPFCAPLRSFSPMSAAFASPVSIRQGCFDGRRILDSVAYRAQWICSTSVGATSKRKMPAVVRPLVPSKALLEFVPDRVQPRSDVLKALCEYAKEQGLQDANDRSLIRCDTKLKSILGVDSCTFLGMNKYLSRHLSRPEDVGGKYLQEAQQYEEQWRKESSLKSKQKISSSRKTVLDNAMASNKGIWTPVTLSSELAHVCGQKEMPRQKIIKAIWDYIRSNNLHSGPGQPVQCDASLKKVFNKESVSTKEIMKGIQPHILKK